MVKNPPANAGDIRDVGFIPEFHLQVRKIPRAVEQRSLCALEPWSCNYLKPHTLEPVIRKRSHCNETPTRCNRSKAQAATKIQTNIK